MNSMPLRFGGGLIHIYGGPYRQRPQGMCGVKLAAEINAPCEIDLPIHDFSIPSEREAKRAILKTIAALAKGDTIYVGCMGGIGRTGLFLALLAKSAGVKDPVEYVRATYYSHAVETPEQKKFVENFSTFWCRFAYSAGSLQAMSIKPKTSKPAL